MFCKQSIMPPQLLISCFFFAERERETPNVIEQRKTVKKSVKIETNRMEVCLRAVLKKIKSSMA